MKKSVVIVTLLVIWSALLMGCASSQRSGSQEVLMRSTLAATPEEVAYMRAKDDKKREDLDAIAAANARVQAFDAVRMEQAKIAQKRVQSYQEAEAAKRRAYYEAQIAERRARIAAEQQALQPAYEALVEEERRKQQEAEAVRLRRGLK